MESMIGRHRGSLVAGASFATALLFLASLVGVMAIDPAPGSGEDRSIVAASKAPEDTTPLQPPIDLEPLLAPAPPGFDRTTPDIDGTVTAEQLAQRRDNPEGALKLFTKLGLQSAYVRTWQRPQTGDVLEVRLYQFGRASAASTYFDLGVEARTAEGSAPFDIPGADRAVGIDAGTEKGKRLVFAFAPKNRIVVTVAAFLSDPNDLEPVRSLVRTQTALLP